jgi:hypothetical protein
VVAAGPLARRTVMVSAAIILTALAGVALPATAASLPAAPYTLALPPPDGDKHSKPPQPCHPKPQCPSDTPTPEPTTHPTNPAPTPTATGGAPAPGGSGPAGGGGGPGPGQPGQSGQPGQDPSDGSGGAGGARPGIVPGQPAVDAQLSGGPTSGAGAGSGGGGQVKQAGPTSLVSAARPFWPILGGGTLLIAVITAVLLISLRDKTNRLVTAEPVGPVEGPTRGVPSPRGPIKVDWVETPGNRVELEP